MTVSGARETAAAVSIGEGGIHYVITIMKMMVVHMVLNVSTIIQIIEG